MRSAAADENNSVFIGVVLKLKFVEDKRRYSRYVGIVRTSVFFGGPGPGTRGPIWKKDVQDTCVRSQKILTVEENELIWNFKCDSVIEQIIGTEKELMLLTFLHND